MVFFFGGLMFFHLRVVFLRTGSLDPVEGVRYVFDFVLVGFWSELFRVFLWEGCFFILVLLSLRFFVPSELFRPSFFFGRVFFVCLDFSFGYWSTQ